MSDQAFSAASIEQYFGYKSHWLSTRDGERIHYLDEGPRDGKVVLLVHGSAIGITAAANFYLTIPALVHAGYRVVAPDMYGFGWTESAPGVEPDLADQVDQVIRVLDALDVPQCYLVGNSLGGIITAWVAMWHPQRVLGNIVIGTARARWKGGPRFDTKTTDTGGKREYDAGTVQRAMRHLVHDERSISPALLEFRTKMAEVPGAYARYLHTIEHRNAGRTKYPLVDAEAAACKVPFLFIFGREDRVNPPEDALAGAEAFPNADLIVFSHCGHWTMVERAQDFNAMMLRFFNGYDQRIANPPIVSNDLRGGDLPLED
jgi:2-hydroxymuconate-semialdehyde hydrolase